LVGRRARRRWYAGAGAAAAVAAAAVVFVTVTGFPGHDETPRRPVATSPQQRHPVRLGTAETLEMARRDTEALDALLADDELSLVGEEIEALAAEMAQQPDPTRIDMEIDAMEDRIHAVETEALWSIEG
ncbi:MAG: hypothetical protein ACOC8F_07730, partial [Planctomycetota bacterium]